jgi:hypothetical protein
MREHARTHFHPCTHTHTQNWRKRGKQGIQNWYRLMYSYGYSHVQSWIQLTQVTKFIKIFASKSMEKYSGFHAFINQNNVNEACKSYPRV